MHGSTCQYSNTRPDPSDTTTVVECNGWMDGVDIFFVLSGYLITRILLSQARTGSIDLGGFWVRRIRRLAPALVVSVVVDGRGQPTGEGASCSRLVPGRQDHAIRRFRPALVIWWSRLELADRLAADGTRLRTGAPAYWQAQRRSFADRIAAATAFGAKVVTVQIERSGRGMSTRCTRARCGPFLHRLVYGTGLRDTWNAILAANHGRSVRSISIDRFVCHDAASPCDDRLADGGPARPDGTHYSGAAGTAVARRIVDEALRVAGLGSE